MILKIALDLNKSIDWPMFIQANQCNYIWLNQNEKNSEKNKKKKPTVNKSWLQFTNEKSIAFQK